MEAVRYNAFDTSKKVLWKSLILYYQQTYDLALQLVAKRIDKFVKIEERPSEAMPEYVAPTEIKPAWKKIIVKSKLPDPLVKLGSLTENLWWTWDDEAQELFEVIDPEIWQKCDQTPAILFEQVKYSQLIELSQNKSYTDKLERVYNRLQDYMAVKPDDKRPAYCVL